MPTKKITIKLLLGLTDNTEKILEEITKKWGNKSRPMAKAEVIRTLIKMYGQFMLTYPDDFSYQTVINRIKEEAENMPKSIEEYTVEYLKAHPEEMAAYIQNRINPQTNSPRTLKDIAKDYAQMKQIFEGDKPQKSVVDILCQTFADAWRDPEIKSDIIKEFQGIVHNVKESSPKSPLLPPKIETPLLEEEQQQFGVYMPTTEDE